MVNLVQDQVVKEKRYPSGPKTVYLLQEVIISLQAISSFSYSVIGVNVLSPVTLKPNDKSTFPVLDTTHSFLLLVFPNDLDLTALFKYPNFGRKYDKFLLWDYSKIWHAEAVAPWLPLGA